MSSVLLPTLTATTWHWIFQHLPRNHLRKGSEEVPRLAFLCIRSAKQVKFESRFEHKPAGQKSEPFAFQNAFCNTSREIAVAGDGAQQGPAKGSNFWQCLGEGFVLQAAMRSGAQQKVRTFARKLQRVRAFEGLLVLNPSLRFKLVSIRWRNRRPQICKKRFKTRVSSPGPAPAQSRH